MPSQSKLIGFKNVQPKAQYIENISEDSLPIQFERTLASNSHILYICSQERLHEVASICRLLYPNNQVITLNSWDKKPYDRTSPSSLNLQTRVKALYELSRLTNSQQPEHPAIIVSCLEALIQKAPAAAELFADCLQLTVGQKSTIDAIVTKLHAMGYESNSRAIEAGNYAKRGSIVDVISSMSPYGIRIDLFGDTLDSIRFFDIKTQRSIRKIDTCEIIPSNELIFNPTTIDTFKNNYEEIIQDTLNPIYDSTCAGVRTPGVENFLPLFYRASQNILNAMPQNLCVFHNNLLLSSLEKLEEETSSRYQERLNFYREAKRNNPSMRDFLPLPPQYLYSSQADFLSLLEGNDLADAHTQSSQHSNPQRMRVIYSRYSAEKADPITANQASIMIAESELSMYPVQKLSPAPNLYQTAKMKKESALTLLHDRIKADKSTRFIICAQSQHHISSIKMLLQQHDSPLASAEIANISELQQLDPGVIALAEAPIEHGFVKGDLTFLAESDLFGLQFQPPHRKHAANKRKKAAIFEEFSNIEPGDLVVHKEFGIGSFNGIENIEVSKKIHELISITYAGGDKIFIPVENLDLITKYGDASESVQLDKLGVSSWQRRKAKIADKIKLQAHELLKTAAARSSATTEHLEPISDLYQRFTDAFPYTETEDQLQAIDDVISDLSSGKPMDRLICGDVGFGKTEVALRAAAYVAATGSKKQIAVVVPTTLLARQHYHTFKERFKELPFKVAHISKFVARSSVNATKKALALGEIDIIIGTHALLSEDVKFANLGLLIIDEEQRFGVKQKERLKKLKQDAHILTLSATPIPRTLNMSLSGIKDLSLITTAPTERKPVATYVTPFDPITIREAIIRELNRDGRVFIVTPRIKFISELEQKIKELVPEAKITSAHGAMKADLLDSTMNKFYDGEHNVMITTTIIESGLDIPSANTIILDRANMFGLAQIYQIRGRVGRGDRKAYAYFTYTNQKDLTANAIKRLDVIQSLDYLGGGFTVASNDMDIRGYGNLVGEEQSGHVKEVGLELYQEMLAEAIASLRQEAHTISQNELDDTTNHSWSPTLSLGVSIQLPRTYIEDDGLRLHFYRKIAAVNSRDELDLLSEEMKDRFGPLPEQAKHLIDIINIKQAAKAANIVKLELKSKSIKITFKDQRPKNEDKVLDLIHRNPLTFSVTNESILIIQNDDLGGYSTKQRLDCVLETISQL